MASPATRPVDPTSPPHRGPRVEQHAILARTRCATATRWRKSRPPELLHLVPSPECANVSVRQNLPLVRSPPN